MRRKPGMFRYLSFGLRIEWMEMFFNIKTNVIVNSSLGPRQKDAFYYYLRDMELIRRNKGLTKFFNRMFIIFKNERIYSNFLWSLLWANLCFNAPLFEWWSIVDTGEYKRDNILSLISKYYGKTNRSVTIAYLSLVGTFERTPIGDMLKQGIIRKQGNSRIVIKQGNPEISPFAVLYALYKFARESGSYKIKLKWVKGDTLSPQRIFTIETLKVENLLRSLWLPDIFEMQREKDGILVKLNQNRNCLDVIDLYIDRGSYK